MKATIANVFKMEQVPETQPSTFCFLLKGNTVHNNKQTALALGALALMSSAISVQAQSFTGWCFPADDCMGEQSPIRGNSFDTCEETCTLQKPVRINGMSANAYERVCRGDGGTRKDRVIIARSTEAGVTSLYYISETFVTKLERCR